MPLNELVDMQAELDRLTKEQTRLQTEVQRADKKLANKGFTDKAPAAVVAEVEKKRAAYQEQLTTLTSRLADLQDSAQ